MPVLSITVSGPIMSILRVPSDKMKIFRIPYGPLSSNMYVITIGDDTFIVDPSVSYSRVTSLVEGFDISSVRAVFATHCHHDHISCADEWRDKLPDVPFYLSSKDFPLLADALGNCSALIDGEVLYENRFTAAEGTITIGQTEITVIATPGHTKGSVCYLFNAGGESALFTGDTVFAGSVGRTDFKGGSYEELSESVKTIKQLEKDLPIYPGHGPASTIAEEIKSNPYFA